jgi:hypothetical protein
LRNIFSVVDCPVWALALVVHDVIVPAEGMTYDVPDVTVGCRKSNCEPHRTGDPPGSSWPRVTLALAGAAASTANAPPITPSRRPLIDRMLGPASADVPGEANDLPRLGDA